MAEMANKAPLSMIVTTSDKLSDLIIKNGQFIFVKDKHRIALDFNNTRTFYNQITELATDYERVSIISPAIGYYFVIGTAMLWYYQDGWTQITHAPEDIVFIGAELPELGQAKENTLYVDKTKKEISVYDNVSDAYVVVADKTDISDVEVTIGTATEDDINSLF